MTAVLDDVEAATAHVVLDQRDELTAELTSIEQQLHEQSVSDSHLLALADSLQRTAEYSGNIAETALNTAARTAQD